MGKLQNNLLNVLLIYFLMKRGLVRSAPGMLGFSQHIYINVIEENKYIACTLIKSLKKFMHYPKRKMVLSTFIFVAINVYFLG